jgi:O-antigen ligase
MTLPFEYLIAISISISLAAILFVKNKLFDAILWICPYIFLLAQLQVSVLDLSRWVILFLLAFISVLFSLKQPARLNPISVGLDLLAVYSIVTSLLSYYPIISLSKGFSILMLAVFLNFLFPCLQALYPRLDAKDYLNKMFLVFSIVIVISNAVYFLLQPGASFMGGRFKGWFINPNGIGAMYGIFFLPMIANTFTEKLKGWRRIGIIGIFLLAMTELLASQSRAGILSGIISMFVLILAKRRWPVRIILSGVLVWVIAGVFIIDPTDNPIRAFIYRNEITLQGSNRLDIWRQTWKQFLVNPVLGTGLGVENTGLTSANLVFTTQGYSTEKTNSYLGLLEELGAVGGGLLLIFLIIPLFRKCWQGLNSIDRKQEQREIILIAIIAGGAANAMFEAWLLSVGSIIALMFWVSAAMLFFSNRASQEKISE